jgi:ATP-dependent RNA helicase RhlE
MKFSDYTISSSIKSQLETLGYKRPTDIQFKAIKPILNGEDVLAIAQTGTGKTGAFAIPVLHVLETKKTKAYKGVRCLVMVPTRELAKQISLVFQEIGKNTSVKTFGLFGGVEQEQQIKTLNNGVDVLVSTPGRMFDLISQGHLDISKLEFLVLDEADLMLDMGFLKDIKDVLKHIPQRRQTLFFSATITPEIKKVAYSVVRNAIRIQIAPDNPVAGNIIHTVTYVTMDDKRFFLENILKEYEKSKFIVFVRTQVRAGRVVEAMKRVGVETEALHGGVEQKDRFAILDRFRTGQNRVLITTDVSARGIDIPTVEYVINYDVPDNPENYVHRCGRCGRGNKKGSAISFCSEEEKPLITAIEAYTGEEIEHQVVNKHEYTNILKDTDDGSYDWKKLLKEDNKERGTEKGW